MQVQATAHARLAESVGVKTGMFHSPAESEKPGVEAGPFPVLPVSAESSGFLPKRNGNYRFFFPFKYIVFSFLCILFSGWATRQIMNVANKKEKKNV